MRTKQTANRDEIRAWVEERGGTLVRVGGTGSEGDRGLLRIDVAGGGDALEESSWDERLEAFDEIDPAFLYQEQTGDGEPSRFTSPVSG